MKHSRFGIFFFAAILLLAAVSASASDGQGEGAPPEKLLSFAQELRAEGETFRAVTEYKRFIHYFPENPLIPVALKGLGLAYAQAGRWEDAIPVFHKLSNRPDSGNEEKMLFGSALYKAQRYAEASKILSDPALGGQAAVLVDLSRLRLGREGETANSDLSSEFLSLKRKNKTTAGLLSAVVPGAGHLYCGRPGDAATSFLVNGAFAWATYASARKGDWALAGILGLFELGWYSGNAVSAMNAAEKWNRREEDRFFNRWETDALPSFTLGFSPDGMTAAVVWDW